MFIKNAEPHSFSLDNFEGPLDFLLYLIQKDEIDIYNVSIQSITDQFKRLEEISVDSGAEFVGLTASLLWIKSKMLLPKHDQEEEEELGVDPEFAIIHHLLDYCKFKEIARDLAIKEEKQLGVYCRGADAEIGPIKRPLGLEDATLEELAQVFQQIMQRSTTQRGLIAKEVWQVGDKIRFIQGLLKSEQRISLETLFLPGQCRDEVIVTFLAILELMKLGEIRVVKETNAKSISIMKKSVGHG
jgi:segregation and condensation protein A